jgi:hypothetical protein
MGDESRKSGTEAIMPEAIEIEDQKVISDTHDTLSGGSETTNNI